MSDKEKNVISKIENQITTKGVSNEFLVQLIGLGETYLNLETIPQYVKRTKMTYKGVKNYRRTIQICGKSFVIDND